MHPSSMVVSISRSSSLSLTFPDEVEATSRLSTCSEVTSPASLSQQKPPSYSGLRLVVPGSDTPDDCLSWPGTPEACASKQLCSQRRLPAPAILKLVSAGSTHAEDVDSASSKLQQLNSCRTARCLDFDPNNHTDLSLWLDQQVSNRTCARSRSIGADECRFCRAAGIQPGGAFGAAAAVATSSLPSPAFQLLGLL